MAKTGKLHQKNVPQQSPTFQCVAMPITRNLTFETQKIELILEKLWLETEEA